MQREYSGLWLFWALLELHLTSHTGPDLKIHLTENIQAKDYFSTCRTYSQFSSATVVTTIQSTTEDLEKADFPKIVLGNNYKMRSNSDIKHI